MDKSSSSSSVKQSRISKSIMIAKTKLMNEIKSLKKVQGNKVSNKALIIKAAQLEAQIQALQTLLQDKQNVIQSQNNQINSLINQLAISNQNFQSLNATVTSFSVKLDTVDQKMTKLSQPISKTVENPVSNEKTELNVPEKKSKFIKYQRMVTAGVPEGAIRVQLVRDGHNPDEFFDSGSDPAPKEQEPIKINPKFAKYQRMKTAGVPEPAIRIQLVRDGLDPDEFFEPEKNHAPKSVGSTKPDISTHKSGNPLLDQIRNKKVLKKVDKQPKQDKPQTQAPKETGMLAELARKAEERKSRQFEVTEALRKKSLERGVAQTKPAVNTGGNNLELLAALKKRKQIKEVKVHNTIN